MEHTNYRQVIVAGQDAFAAEQALVEAAAPLDSCGTRDSDALVRWQTSRGNHFLPISLHNTIYGWSVRYASGLQNFGLLFGHSNSGNDGSFEASVAFAVRFCAEDPANRYAYVIERVS